MMLALRISILVFVAAVFQVAAIAGGRILGAEVDLLLLTILGIALVAGSIPGAAAGFAGGLLVDVMTLGTLGFTSILLTLAGYWSGRYGETTGRDRGYAPSLTALVMTAAVDIGAAALHFLLGETVPLTAVLWPIVPSAILAALLIIPIHRLCRSFLTRRSQPQLSREVELV